MVYIYKTDVGIGFVRDERPAGEVIELERMIPIPVKQGYVSVLHADFSSKEVWYDMVAAPLSLDEVRREKMAAIDLFDTGNSVNSFTLAGKALWLDKATRVGLMNSIGIEQTAGKTATTLWFDGVRYDIPIALALQMLNALELYALDCYNATQGHIAAVVSLQTIEEVQNYDYTSGYPEKLVFNL